MIGGKLKAARPFLVLAAVMLLPGSTLAQTVNPTQAYFDRSVDHDATDSTGTPLVQSYQLQFYLVGASAPFQVVSLGKPTPDALGVINVNLTTIFMGWPVPGTNYFADVAAVGPGGSTASAPSNTFSFSGPTCNFTVSPTSHSVLAAGGSQTTGVTTASGCAWTATSNATWITVTGGGSGTGNGTVTYTVAANTATSPRMGTLTVAGQTVTVTQGGTCGFTVSPTSQSVLAAGASHTTNVTTGSGCAWTVTSNAVWITVVGSSSRTGSGTVTYTVPANSATSPRTGTVTVAGQTLTVTQSGTCGFTVSPTSHSVVAAGGSLTTSVTTASGCAWTVTSNAAWITVVGGSSRTGSGTVTSTVAANTAPSERMGTLTIAAQTVTVTEAATPGSPPSAPPNLRIVSP